MHHHWLKTGLLAAGLSVCTIIAAAQTTKTVSQKQPNIVFILADDLDYADLGVTGGTKTPTPNIDSIAKNGMSFPDAYVSSPICGPSRVGILTGLYQDRVGYVCNHGPIIPKNFGLPTTDTLISETLQKAGYATGMIGKWHLGFKTEMTPPQRGFDYFFGHLHGYHDYRPGSDRPGPILRNDKPVKTTKYLTTEFGAEAAGFIRRNKDNPYFLYVPFNAVHDPMQAPEKDLEKFSNIKDKHNRIMAGMIYEMDNAVGEILKAVHESGNEDSTLIIFYNDNGGARGWLPESNGVLRDGKGSLYEGGIRVPLYMQWNNVIPAGSTYDKPVIGLDLAPTFVALAHTTSTVDYNGVNLMPYILGKNNGTPHDKLFWKFTDAPNQKAVREGDWKAVQPADKKPWELYNITKDIGETTNIAAEHPDKLKQLRKDWRQWDSKNAAPLFMDVRILRRRTKIKARQEGKQIKPATNNKSEKRKKKRKHNHKGKATPATRQ